MRQNTPQTDTGSVTVALPSALKWVTRTLAGSSCAVLLSIPLDVPEAVAQDWQVTTRYHSNGSTRTFRRLKPENWSINELKNGPAPGNDCPMLAFEVMNPKRGEARCVVYLP